MRIKIDVLLRYIDLIFLLPFFIIMFFDLVVGAGFILGYLTKSWIEYNAPEHRKKGNVR